MGVGSLFLPHGAWGQTQISRMIPSVITYTLVHYEAQTELSSRLAHVQCAQSHSYEDECTVILVCSGLSFTL